MKRRRKARKRLIELMVIVLSLSIVVFGAIVLAKSNEPVKDGFKTEYIYDPEPIVLVIEREVYPDESELIDKVEEEEIEETPRQITVTLDERYLLAKLVMAESGSESYDTKKYVCQTVINRVLSSEFPNSVEEVVYQDYQFTPTFMPGWDSINPSDECFNAVDEVLNSTEPIISALYFEACEGESWHSRNLNLLVDMGSTRFYNYRE